MVPPPVSAEEIQECQAPAGEEVVVTTEETVELVGKEEPYEWLLKDQVALINTVFNYGTDNWPAIDEVMAEYADAVVGVEHEDDEEIWRPEGWYGHESC